MLPQERPPADAPRQRAALALVATSLLAMLLLAWPQAQARGASFCSHRSMFIVAHQDDDLLFQSPDVLEAIAAGDCVETVFLTAGDAGLGTAYWQEREAGSRAAYAVMAGVPDAWTNFERTVSGHLVHGAALTGNPDVSEVYLRLPNGGSTGSGYAATGFKSLPRLWRSQNPQPASLTPISELTALDGSATYTYNGLLATLQALIAEFEPDVIATQEFTREFGTGDHADHVATAKLARIAADAYGPKHILLGFMDYNTQNQPVNVFEPVLAQKLSAYYAYAAHDSNEACSTLLQCEQPLFSSYYAWQRRQYITAETSVPGANAGANQAVASGAGVTLDGSKSADPLGHSLSFHWAQTGGTAVTLSSKTAVKPTFTAPVGPATLTFSLTVESSEATSSPATVTVNVAKPFYALKVTKSGNGQGTVTSSPAGISCGADCEESYESGKEVTLTPSPAAGSEFKGWSGACTGTGTCKVTISAAREVGAAFALERHSVSITVDGTGSGTVTSSPAGISCGAVCSGDFEHGTQLALSAFPAAGTAEAVWAGCDAVDGQGRCIITVDAARTVTATLNSLPAPEPQPKQTPEEQPQPTPEPEPEPQPAAIKLKAARILHRQGKVRFVFTAAAEARFQCALGTVRQKLRYRPCTSPATYSGLGPGAYVFKVRATGPGATAKVVTKRFRVRAIGTPGSAGRGPAAAR